MELDEWFVDPNRRLEPDQPSRHVDEPFFVLSKFRLNLLVLRSMNLRTFHPH
jgi:hypothetical protein